jgi:DNA-binding transcriptional ArsR family regulator
MELLRLTKLPERTLRHNLSALRKQGLVGEVFLLGDMRRKVYFLRKGLQGLAKHEGNRKT